jgi:hypothetical protein
MQQPYLMQHASKRIYKFRIKSCCICFYSFLDLLKAFWIEGEGVMTDDNHDIFTIVSLNLDNHF